MNRIIEARLPETSKVHQHGTKYLLQAYDGSEFRFHVPVFRPIAAEISKVAFSIEKDVDALKEVGGNMAAGASIIFATLIETGEVVAYSTQRILKPPFEPGVRVMYTSTRAVVEEHRKNGLATALLTYANTLHGGPDILCGTTPNPEIVDLYERSGIIVPDTYSPRRRSYEEAPRLKRVVEYVVGQTKGSAVVMSPKGVLHGIYKDGWDAYDNTTAKPETQETYAWMESLEYRQFNGDAIVIAGIKKGRTHFVERALEAA